MIKDLIKETIKSRLNKKRPPWNIILFVTSNCNSKCRHCFFWKNIDNPNKPQDLTLEEIEKISKNLGKVYWLYLSGGEPFLRNDLSEIVAIFRRNNKAKIISIPTNGILTDVIIKETRRILEENPGINLNLQLSLDGREEIHEYIRGIPGLFQKILILEKSLAEMKKEFPNLSTLICSVLNKANVEELVPLMKFVRENMDVDFHSIELMRGTPRDKEFTLPGLEEIKKFFAEYRKNRNFYIQKDYRYHKKYYKKNIMKNIYGNITTKMNNWLDKIQLEILEKNKKLITCTAAGSIFGVIGEAGDVFLCELLPKVGNLRENNYDFKKIWFSEEANKQREFIKDKCFCTHCLFLTKSAIMQPKIMIKAMLENGGIK